MYNGPMCAQQAKHWGIDPKNVAMQQKRLAYPARVPKIRPMLHCNMT